MEMVMIVIDIETLPTDREDVKQMIAAGITPPGSMKKPETIAKWEAEQKPAAVEEAIANGSSAFVLRTKNTNRLNLFLTKKPTRSARAKKMSYVSLPLFWTD
jgi:hypothetical protein